MYTQKFPQAFNLFQCGVFCFLIQFYYFETALGCVHYNTSIQFLTMSLRTSLQDISTFCIVTAIVWVLSHCGCSVQNLFSNRKSKYLTIQLKSNKKEWCPLLGAFYVAERAWHFLCNSCELALRLTAKAFGYPHLSWLLPSLVNTRSNEEMWKPTLMLQSTFQNEQDVTTCDLFVNANYNI